VLLPKHRPIRLGTTLCKLLLCLDASPRCRTLTCSAGSIHRAFKQIRWAWIWASAPLRTRTSGKSTLRSDSWNATLRALRARDLPTQSQVQRTWIRGREIRIGLLRCSTRVLHASSGAGVCRTPAMFVGAEPPAVPNDVHPCCHIRTRRLRISGHTNSTRSAPRTSARGPWSARTILIRRPLSAAARLRTGTLSS
jgi:hypothetical protein